MSRIYNRSSTASNLRSPQLTAHQSSSNNNHTQNASLTSSMPTNSSSSPTNSTASSNNNNNNTSTPSGGGSGGSMIGAKAFTSASSLLSTASTGHGGVAPGGGIGGAGNPLADGADTQRAAFPLACVVPLHTPPNLAHSSVLLIGFFHQDHQADVIAYEAYLDKVHKKRRKVPSPKHSQRFVSAVGGEVVRELNGVGTRPYRVECGSNSVAILAETASTASSVFMVAATNLHPVCTSRLEDSSSNTAAGSNGSASLAHHHPPPPQTPTVTHISLSSSLKLSSSTNASSASSSGGGAGLVGGMASSGGGGTGVANNASPGGVRVRVRGEAIDLAVGPYHGAVVTESELVYTWGYNINCSTIGLKGADNLRELSKADPNFEKSGQLGRGELFVAAAGRVRELPSKALMVACGGVHTACLTVDGLYVWGLNDEGQLGLPPSEARIVSIPRLMTSARATFVSVACGAHHTVALTNNGHVFAWGLNSCGQVCPDKSRLTIDTPTLVHGVERALQVACGAVHTAALSSNGTCYTWGGNSYGQLGTERHDFESAYIIAALARTVFVTSIACGPHSTAFCDDMGNVHVCGRLMAPGMIDHQSTPRRLDCIKHLFVTSVACGQTHIAVLVHRELTSKLEHFKRAQVYNVDAPLNVRSIFVPRTWTELKRVVRELLFIEPERFNGGEVRSLADVLNACHKPIGVSGTYSSAAAKTVAVRVRFGMHSSSGVAQRNTGSVLTRMLSDTSAGAGRPTTLSPGRSTAKAMTRAHDGTLTRHTSLLQMIAGTQSNSSGSMTKFSAPSPQVDVAAYIFDDHLSERRKSILSFLDKGSAEFDAQVQAHLRQRVVESDMPPQLRSVSSKRVVSAVKKAIDEEQAKAIANAKVAAASTTSKSAPASPEPTSLAQRVSSAAQSSLHRGGGNASGTNNSDSGNSGNNSGNNSGTNEGDDSYEDEVGHDAEVPTDDDSSFRTATCSITRGMSGSSTFHGILTASGGLRPPSLETIFEHHSEQAVGASASSTTTTSSKATPLGGYAPVQEDVGGGGGDRSGKISGDSVFSDDEDESSSSGSSDDDEDSSSSSSTTSPGGSKAVWKTTSLAKPPSTTAVTGSVAPMPDIAPAATSYAVLIEDDVPTPLPRLAAPALPVATPPSSHKAVKVKKSKRSRQSSASDVPDDGNYSLQWNRRFQSTLKAIRTAQGPEERVACYSELSSLVTDFIYLAETYARIIISEAYMPVERKTIKPSKKFGGVAGGDKYIVHGILFKFANNSQGLYPNDEAASKVAGHDLKGLRTYFNCGIPALHFPLMALVDYSGFRMSCMSMLPITKDTLIYGSCDGALTVATEPKIGTLIAQAARKINIKAHMAGRRKAVEIYSPVDVEGHCGSDGKYYLIDYSRVMPPEKPVKGLRSAHMFRLLRPEYVKQYHTPLCSDACSRFVPEADMREHNEEVSEATAVLKDEVIPAVAMDLQTLRHGWDFSLQSVLHSRGANLRYLGLLRSHTRDPELRNLILVEMVARVVKTELREKMRAVLRQSVLPLEDPRRQAVILHLNVVFGNSDQAREYWGEHLKSRLMEKFERALSAEELKATYDLKLRLCKEGGMESKLFVRVQQIMGLKFIPSVMREFSKPSTLDADVFNSYAPFDETDMEELGCRVKHLNIVERALGYILKTKARKHGIDPNARRRLLKQAMSKFDAALESDPDNKGTLRNYSDVLALNGEFERADFYYRRALEVDPHDTSTLFAYAVFLEQIDRLAEAEAFFVRCLEIDQFNDHCLQAYGYFIEEKLHDSDVAEQFYQLASRVRQAKMVTNQLAVEPIGELFEH